MTAAHHEFSDLFDQLGLASDEDSIHQFIVANAPLPEAVRLEEAPFWTAPQARLLRESLAQDADWAVVVDRLNVALRSV